MFAQFDYYWFYLSLSNHMNATNSTWDDPYNYPIVDYFGEFFSADSFSLSADAYELNLENLYGGLIAPFDDPVSFI